MKTAEEWAGERWDKFEKGISLIEHYKQIQLDAYKAGMTEAADIAKPNDCWPHCKSPVCETRDCVARQILFVRDKKETL